MMNVNEWVKWYQYGENGMIDFGQMPRKKIQESLSKFISEAGKVLSSTKADHVVYGLKIYNEEGVVECVKFYMLAMTDDEFQKDVASLKNCTVYALHKH